MLKYKEFYHQDLLSLSISYSSVHSIERYLKRPYYLLSFAEGFSFGLWDKVFPVHNFVVPTPAFAETAMCRRGLHPFPPEAA